MADTSLIFNIIARDSGLGRALDGIANRFHGAGAAAEEALERAGNSTENLDRQIAEAQTRVRALSEEFERTGDKTLFSKISRDRSLISQLSKIRDELRGTGNDAQNLGRDVDRAGSFLTRAAGAAVGFGGSLVSAGGSAASMLSSIGGLVVVTAALSAGMFVAAPALYAFGGAAASIPAMLSGAIAAIAVLKMGMSGLSENWSAMNAPKMGGGGGGGGAAAPDLTPKIRAVEAAQRDVTRSARDYKDALGSLKDAQLQVAEAHEVARERLEDLDREYRQSQIDRQESVANLEEAQQQLNLALVRGNPDEIRKAQLAVEKQRLEVERATDKAEDLGKENAEAARKGVEGSDEVVAARKREADAQRQVQDAALAHTLAIQRLADAQKSLKDKTDAASAAGGGMATVLPKIAASAQEFLDKLKSLKPAFDALRLDIQQRLFAGLADKLQILADRWLPALHVGLGGIADTINGVVKTAFDSLSNPTFISNMMVGLEAFRGMLGKIGQAIAGPLVRAWGQLTAAASPVLDVIGDKIAGIIIKFSDWIDQANRSGELQAFMEKAAHILGTTFDILTDLARIAGSVVSILFGTDLGGTDAWDNLEIAIHKLADFLGDPKVQANISRFLNMFGGAVFGVGTLMAKMDEIGPKVQAVIGWFQALPNRVGNAISALPGVLGHWASVAINQLGYYIGYGIGWVIKQFFNLPGNTLRALASLPSIFSRIGSWLWNAVSNLYPMMLNVGKNVVLGIWNGIVSLSGWLWQQAYNFAAGIWRGVQSALGIGSPSKVMADKVGQWIPAGIAMGMNRNGGVIQDAIDNVAAMLSSADLPSPTVGMDAALDAVNGTLTVGARRQRIEVTQVLDVRGQDGALKTLIRGMARTDNLYQTNKG